MKQIAVVGTGGVGGFFGGKLCRSLVGDATPNLTLVARGEHLKAIQQRGLVLNTEKDGQLICHPSAATDDFASLPKLDVVLLCVKAFDLTSALEQLAPALQEETVILPLLNGVDIHSRIRRTIQTGIVLPACVYVGTHIESPGVVTQRGGACRILYGPDPQTPDFFPRRLDELFQQASILAQWTPTVQTSIWEKFIFICSFGLVTAAHNVTIGNVLDTQKLKALTIQIIREILQVADRLNVELPANIESSALEKAETFPYETKTSFQRDFEVESKPDERDLFAGAMLEYGREFDLDLAAIKAVSLKLAEMKPTTT